MQAKIQNTLLGLAMISRTTNDETARMILRDAGISLSVLLAIVAETRLHVDATTFERIMSESKRKSLEAVDAMAAECDLDCDNCTLHDDASSSNSSHDDDEPKTKSNVIPIRGNKTKH